MSSDPPDDVSVGDIGHHLPIFHFASPEAFVACPMAESGILCLETLAVSAGEDLLAKKDAARDLAIDCVVRRRGNESPGSAVGGSADVAKEAAPDEKEMEENDESDLRYADEMKVIAETETKNAAVELNGETMMDKGDVFNAEFCGKIDADAAAFGDKNAQVEEHELRKRRRRGRRRRSTIVEERRTVRYLQPFQDENKDSFAISDLVWGKVRSHPWWPGWIFGPSVASDIALSTQKEDHHLVLYFGDKTFAWCQESNLKPFQRYFTQMEKQGRGDVFGTAVNDALAEVSRHLELGMRCICSQDEAYAVLKDLWVENAGVQEGTCSCAVNKSWIMNSFEPKKMMDYIRLLAMSPCRGADTLDLVIAKAHLKAFHCTNGCLQLPVSVLHQELEDNDESLPATEINLCNGIADMLSPVSSAACFVNKELRRRSRTKRDKMYVLSGHRKRKSLSELTDDKCLPHHIDCHRNSIDRRDPLTSSTKRQKIACFYPVISGKRKMKKLDSLGDMTMASLNCSKQFRAKEHNDRIMGKSKKSPTFIKRNSPRLSQKRNAVFDYPNSQMGTGRLEKTELKDCSPYKMSSGQCLAAINPLNMDKTDKTDSFFNGFRVVSCSSEDKGVEDIGSRKQSRSQLSKSKTVLSDLASPCFIQDSYWSDIIVCSNLDEQLESKSSKGNGETQVKRLKKKEKAQKAN
ncbi:uncharacterized protein LOC121998373 [Zingiber officinale]|uniref:PWWP domain-containing protein n=1 Tax=Zingiber officinale TaxID=94328 RepID=A0A8J5GJ91_ZINOF|nr:uncharacterized protein LOC121998373 [Zingiber officinale]KAG6501947.1 hypothetical protein ZIOFF_041831 [Zingiber officinale]